MPPFQGKGTERDAETRKKTRQAARAPQKPQSTKPVIDLSPTHEITPAPAPHAYPDKPVVATRPPFRPGRAPLPAPKPAPPPLQPPVVQQVHRTDQKGRLVPPPPAGVPARDGVPTRHPGMITKPTIDASKRTPVPFQGGIATVRTATFTYPSGKAVLLPTVIGGKVVTPAEAWQHYEQTGEHLGIFRTEKQANRYAFKLHEAQAQRIEAVTRAGLLVPNRAEEIRVLGPGMAFAYDVNRQPAHQQILQMMKEEAYGRMLGDQAYDARVETERQHHLGWADILKQSIPFTSPGEGQAFAHLSQQIAPPSLPDLTQFFSNMIEPPRMTGHSFQRRDVSQEGFGAPQLLNNLVQDMYQSTVGAPAGTAAALADPKAAVKAIWEDYKRRYGSALHGNFGPLAEHPLFALLDAGTVLDWGIRAGTAGGLLRDASLIRKIRVGEGTVQLYNPGGGRGFAGWMARKLDAIGEAHPDMQLLGNNQRAGAALRLHSERDLDALRAQTVPFQKAVKKLNGVQRVAYDIMARYGDHAPGFLELEINGREARLANPDITRAERIAQKAQLRAIRAVTALVVDPPEKLARAMVLGRETTHTTEGMKTALKQLKPGAAGERTHLSARIWGELPKVEDNAARVALYDQMREEIPDMSAPVASVIVTHVLDAAALNLFRETGANPADFYNRLVPHTGDPMFNPAEPPEDLPPTVLARQSPAYYHANVVGYSGPARVAFDRVLRETKGDTQSAMRAAQSAALQAGDADTAARILDETSFELARDGTASGPLFQTPEVDYDGIMNTLSVEGHKFPGGPKRFRKALEHTVELSIRGAKWRDWYQRAGEVAKSVSEWEGFSVDKTAQLMALYSQSANPTANMAFAIRAMREFRDQGEVKTLGAGGKHQREKANALLKNEDWRWDRETDPKLSSFYNNILEEADPELWAAKGRKAVTVDRWVVRMLWPSSGKVVAGQHYAVMEDALTAIAGQLGWAPKEVQAASWVTIKAESLLKRYKNWPTERAFNEAGDAYEAGMYKHAARLDLFGSGEVPRYSKGMATKPPESQLIRRRAEEGPAPRATPDQTPLFQQEERRAPVEGEARLLGQVPPEVRDRVRQEAIDGARIHVTRVGDEARIQNLTTGTDEYHRLFLRSAEHANDRRRMTELPTKRDLKKTSALRGDIPPTPGDLGPSQLRKPGAPRDDVLYQQGESRDYIQQDLEDMKGDDLKGLPGPVEVPGMGKIQFHSNAEIQQLEDVYMRQIRGVESKPPTDYVKADPKVGARTAGEYDRLVHAPKDPQVASAFNVFIKETMDQYKLLERAGYKFEFYPEGHDPYPNSPREAIMDLVTNRHMYVYPTDAGFGSGEALASDHPLLQIAPGVEWGGKQVTFNDIFRAVHDVFGHAKEGVGFRADGEFNAWRQHAAMYSHEARRAMTTETHGQNSWVNFGPHAGTNATAKTGETIFADQKAGLLPRYIEALSRHVGAPPLPPKGESGFGEAAAAALADANEMARDVAKTLPEEEWPQWVKNNMRRQRELDTPSDEVFPEDWLAQRGARMEVTELPGVVHGAQLDLPNGKLGIWYNPESSGADTAIHEAGHVIRKLLPERQVKELESALGVVDGQWTRNHEEVFARAVERYFWHGEAPSPQLREGFAQIRAALREQRSQPVKMRHQAPGTEKVEIKAGGFEHQRVNRVLDEVFNPALGIEAGDGAFFMPDVASWRGKGVGGGRRKSLKYPPEGMKRNRGILQQQGRIQRGPKVTLMEFNRVARQYENRVALAKLDEIAQPLDLEAFPETGGVPNGYMLYNPKGIEIPRVFREVPTSDDLFGRFPHEMANEMRHQRDELVLNTFPRSVDDVPEEYRNGVKILPEAIVKAFTGDRVTIRMTKSPLMDKLAATLDLTNSIAKAATIYGKLSYIPLNFAGNLFFLGLAQGPFAAASLVRAAQGIGRLSPEVLARMDLVVGEGAAASLALEERNPVSRAIAMLAHGQSMVADRLPRRASFVYQAARHGFRSEDDLMKLLRGSGEEWKDGITYKEALFQIAEQAERDIVQFRGMSPFQKEVVSRALFIYGWVRGATKYGMHTAVTRPFRTNIMLQLGQKSWDDFEKKVGHVVSYLNGLMPIGDIAEKFGVKTIPVMNTRSMNPVSTFGETMQALANFVGGNPAAGGSQVVDMLTPGVKTGIELMTGYNTFLQQPYDNRWQAVTDQVGQWPGVRITRNLIHPGVSIPNPDDPANRQPNFIGKGSRKDAILEMLLGSSRPQTLNIDAATARGREEQGKANDPRANALELAQKAGQPPPPEAVLTQLTQMQQLDQAKDDQGKLVIMAGIIKNPQLAKDAPRMGKQEAHAIYESIRNGFFSDANDWQNAMNQIIDAKLEGNGG